MPKQSRELSRKTKTVWIAAKDLRIHPTAQRRLNNARVKKLTKEFDLDAIGVLYAVEYEIDGANAVWVIDGQHRQKILMDLGFGDWEVEVKIYTAVTDAARASKLFIELNNRGLIPPFDSFENARLAGQPDALDIVDITSKLHLKIDRCSRDGHVCCVAVLTKVYHYDGGAALAATLNTLVEAWGHTAAAVEGKLIEGLGTVFKIYPNGGLEPAVLVKKLAKYPGGPSALIGDARGLRKFNQGSIARCIAAQIVKVYNASRKSGTLQPL